jgi:hypothetical protein
MTYAPRSLQDLGAYWTGKGGVNLGIVGDTRHVTGYHLGRDRIYSDTGQGDADYSVKHPRDKAGLTNGAASIDLGKLDGTFAGLQEFSRWLVSTSEAGGDIREIIYSPDGDRVQRWSGIDGDIHTGTGNGDLSHRWHTHISYFRDSEARDKIEAFSGYWEDHDVAQKAITTTTPRTVVIHAGDLIYDLDGKTELGKSAFERTVISPCGRGTAPDGRRHREWYVDLDGAGTDPRRSVISRVADADFLPVPVPEPPPSTSPDVLTGNDGSVYLRQ